MPIPIRGFFSRPPGDESVGPARIKEAPIFCLVPICFTALGCIVLFFFADEVYRLLQPLVAP
jgi:multicomponent Na+:H+ antiporter subunit D